MLARDRYRRHRLRPLDYLLGLALIAAHLALLMSTMDMGFTRDEGYYFHAAETYNGWFDELTEHTAAGHAEDSFTQENIDRHWELNPEHPVLMKTLFGLSWDSLSRERDILSPSSAMRFPAAVLSALLVGLLFWFVVEAFGTRIGGLFAVSALVLMPRYFFHAHLACFDSAISTLWFAVVYAYWRSLHSRTWAILTGVVFGVALITKLNAFFIPFALLAHWAIGGWRSFRFEGTGWGRRLRIPDIPLAFPAMIILGPLIFYLGWPRHWFDTYNRIAWYLGFHLNHVHYFVNYWGEALVRPPFPTSFPLMMTLVTVPVVTLVTALFGGVRLLSEPWRRRSSEAGPVGRDARSTGLLIAINLVLPLLIIARPDTPIFGGTKHWMQAMPYLCMLSGLGLTGAVALALRRPDDAPDRPTWLQPVLTSLLGILLCVPMANATASVHPHGVAYYNTLVGGVRGAADRGLMRQFWGYSTRDGLEWVNSRADGRTFVFAHNANNDAMSWYRRDGLLGDEIREVYGPDQVAIAPTASNQRRVPQNADFSFYNHQRAFIPVLQEIWEVAGTEAPAAVWGVNGVPVLSVYAGPDYWQRVPPPADVRPGPGTRPDSQPTD